MQQLDKRIATLRLRLAEIRAREEQQTALQRQFRSQTEKIVDFAARDNSDLDSALSMIDEVDARYDQVARTLRHLGRIKAKAQEELDALVLTRSIEVARQELVSLEGERQRLASEIDQRESMTAQAAPVVGSNRKLESRRRDRLSELEVEIRHIRQRISDASEEAARTVSMRMRETA